MVIQYLTFENYLIYLFNSTNTNAFKEDKAIPDILFCPPQKNDAKTVIYHDLT